MQKFIPTHNVKNFLKEIAKLNTKLAKYGSKVTITCEKNTFINVGQDERLYYIGGEVNPLTKNWATPQIMIKGTLYNISEPEVLGKEGVSYLGSVVWIDGTAQIHSASEENLLQKIEVVASGVCDHCNVNRDRNKWYYFEEEGTVKRIGSTCVKEWFGFDLEKVFASYERFIAIINVEEDEEEEVVRASKFANMMDVIACLADATNNFQTAWDKETTKSTVDSMLKDRDYKIKFKATEEHKQAIVEKWNINAWTDFEFNIVSALLDQNKELAWAVSFANLGVVCWAIHNTFYQKAKVNAENIGEFLGEVKEKITFSGTLKVVHSFCTDYGITNVYIIETEKGLVKWNTSPSFNFKLEEKFNIELHEVERLLSNEGIKVTMQGTIKELTEYNEQKQTVCTRCKLK